MKHDVPAVVMVGPSRGVCTALGVVRSLGRKGVPVILLVEKSGHPAASSRYVEAVYACGGENEDAVVNALLGIAARIGAPAVVFPTSDYHCLLLAKHAEQLEHSFLWSRNSPETIQIFTDKSKVDSVAERAGIRRPSTMVVRSVSEAENALRIVPPPYVIKPACNDLIRSEKIVKSKLRLLWKAKAVRLTSQQAVMDMAVQAEHAAEAFIIQEYIPGDDTDVYSISPYIGGFRPYPIFVAKKLRQHPGLFGWGCYSVTEPAWEKDKGLSQAATWSIDFAEAAGFKGICSIEWKRHKNNGLFYLIDPNPRVCQFNILFSRSGLNMQFWTYWELVYKHAAKVDTDRQIIKHFFCDILTDIKACASRNNKDVLWWMKYPFQLGRPIEFAYLAVDDPLPGVRAVLGEFFYMLKYYFNRF